MHQTVPVLRPVVAIENDCFHFGRMYFQLPSKLNSLLEVVAKATALQPDSAYGHLTWNRNEKDVQINQYIETQDQPNHPPRRKHGMRARSHFCDLHNY